MDRIGSQNHSCHTTHYKTHPLRHLCLKVCHNRYSWGAGKPYFSAIWSPFVYPKTKVPEWRCFLVWQCTCIQAECRNCALAGILLISNKSLWTIETHTQRTDSIPSTADAGGKMLSTTGRTILLVQSFRPPPVVIQHDNLDCDLFVMVYTTSPFYLESSKF